MGSCCSKRSRRNDSETYVAALHPSLENWKVRKASGFSELDLAGDGAAGSTERMPVMWVKPPLKPSLGFPSIHYNVNASLLCDSTHSSSRSLGAHCLKHHSTHLSVSSSKCFEDDSTLSNQRISGHHFGLSLSSRHNPDVEPDSEMPPSFSFAAQPYIEPDFVNTAFAFHPPVYQNLGLTAFNVNSNDGIKLKVRHKHMFPRDLLNLPSSDLSSQQFPAMKRSRSDGKLPAEEGHLRRAQPHRRSFQETLLGGWYDLSNDMIELAKDRIDGAGAPPMAALVGNSDASDSSSDEDEDGFLDINVRDSIGSRPTSYADARSEQMLEDIKYCISMEVSSHSKANFSKDEWQERHADEEGDINNVAIMQPLSVVSTGDAVLFSGSHLNELHLIPSKFVPQSHSPPTSPRINLTPLTLTRTVYHNEDGDDKASNISVEDIITLLESDDVNEDEILSLLINSNSPSMSPTSLSPTSMLSISSMSASPLLLPSTSGSLTPSPMSSSFLSSSSSSSSPSSPPSARSCRLPCSTIASTSTSLSLSTLMPVMLPFSTPSASKPLPQSSTSRRISPTASFEFKVKSCNSAASTPMFSPIRSTGKRNIAHLKPTALTTEEIAEIWGVFEQRQALATPH